MRKRGIIVPFTSNLLNGTIGDMNKIEINWKFPDLLKRHNITPYKLHKHLTANGCDVSRTTIYRWAREAPSALELRLVTDVLSALDDLRKGPELIKLADIIDTKKGSQ